MKRAFLGLLATAALFSVSAQAADTYTFDPTHTSVIWKAGHMDFSNPHGIFPMVEGTLVLDEKSPANSSVEAVIKTGQIVTGISKFDDHLKNADFFDVAKFPEAKFKSTKVDVTGEKTAKVTGDLTLLGVTKPVILDITFNKSAPNPMSQKPTVGFSATGVIKRSDFGIKYGLPNIPDDVHLTIEAEANREATPAAQ